LKIFSFNTKSIFYISESPFQILGQDSPRKILLVHRENVLLPNVYVEKSTVVWEHVQMTCGTSSTQWTTHSTPESVRLLMQGTNSNLTCRE